ncbi:MAG: hypothetical protein EPO16_08415 [Dehalococcoidia bacterium]|nr:MAG: hypothetical protein EPO16_08415 [Dehalococcoidia bacterium]
MWYWNGDFGGWAWLWMTFMMAVMWLPLLIGGWWIATQLGRRHDAPPPPPPDHDALEIARRAYARGDLDRERYLQIVADLGEQPERGKGR